MKHNVKIITSLFIITSLLFLSGCGCKKNGSRNYRIKMEVWGPLDDSYTFSEIFETYQKMNPQVGEVSYKKMTLDTYKKDLLNALASGQGPDVFLIHSTWLPEFQDKIVAAPATVIPEQKFRQDFVDVAVQDFLVNGVVWAVPLSVDSLGLYYNKDLFNAAGITTPPKTWEEFVEDVKKLTTVVGNGEITRAGAALGTAYNINRSTDVLTLLMLQSGTQMVDEYGSITMDRSQMVNGQLVSSSENALNFYTQFANVGSPVYTWNSSMHYSIDAFAEGLAAMMFNYSWHIKTIQEKSPKLNFAVAPIPQFPNGQPTNYANYWAFAVSKNKDMRDISATSEVKQQPLLEDSIRVDETWKLVSYLTLSPTSNIELRRGVVGAQQVVNYSYDPAQKYIETTGKPAARRDIIEKQKIDPQLGAFAQGNLIAKSWRQREPDAMEAILADTIDQVNKGSMNVRNSIKNAAQRMQQLVNR
jgi:ABC-type glycerol-3-phosphate transport system substrate-binding protein